MNTRILTLLSSIIALSTIIPSVSAYDFTGCDQIFPVQQLRHGYSYRFWDDYTNNNTFKHQVFNLPSVVYSEQFDYNGSTTFPSFGWAVGLVAQGYQINPSQTMRAVDADSSYPIIYRPLTRNADNLILRYTLQYFAQNAGVNWTGPYTHVECQPYEITWCGDGVKDSSEGETCDDGAQNGQPGKCNLTCNGTVPNPPINGVCNPAYDGQTLPGPYTWASVSSVVCTSGTPVEGTGFPNGPWTWSCNGQNGGTNASCSAAKTPPPINGVCSSTVTGPQSSPLSNGACNVGPVIGFTSVGTGPVNYSWTCGGQNGGSPSSTCSASYNAPPPPVAGVCSSTVTGPQSSPLSNGSCNVGNVAGFTSVGTNPVNYSWTCTGLNGGASSTTCNASYTPPPPPVNGVCSSTVTGPQAAPISNGACNVGSVVGFTSVGVNPINYSWTCSGQNGGSSSPSCTASYTAAPVNGVCGPTNGTNVASTPSSGLCNVGAPSAVAGTGPWTWSCAGSNGGTTATCGANPIPINGVCGPAHGVVTSTAPVSGLCNVGTPSGVAGTGPWTWSCAGSNGGTNANCNAPVPPPLNFKISVKKYIDGVDAQDTEPPVVKNVGDTGNYTVIVRNEGPNSTSGTTTVIDDLPFYIQRNGVPYGTNWNCGASTATRIDCQSTRVVASGAVYPTLTIPVKVITGAVGTIRNLAIVSTSSSIGSTVPGKDRDPASIIIRQNGKCSSSLSGNLLNPISAGSCDIGSPINFTAVGVNPINYSWACSGVGGGSNSPACTASYSSGPINGVCGPAHGVVTSTAPVSGLCNVGTPSGVAGTGPWTWSCAGSNGGTNANCNAPVPPPLNFKISVKKYIDGVDAQDTEPPVVKNVGDTGNYTVIVRNEGPNSTSGTTTVIDDLPFYIQRNGVPYGTNWNCGASTATRIDCQSTRVVASGAVYPTLTIPVKVITGAVGTIRNLAIVSTSSSIGSTVPGKDRDPASIIIRQNGKCSSSLSGNLLNPISAGSCDIGSPINFTAVGVNPINYSWACSGVGGGSNSPACTASYATGAAPGSPLLNIKKAAQGQDGQSLADAAQVTPGSAFSYTYTVANTGSGSATGVTITDTFPRYVSVTAVPTGTDWTCAKGTKVVSGITYHTVICTYTKPLLANTTAPVVTVPAMLDPATPSGSALRNIAYVCRTGDTSPECNPICTNPNDPSCTPPPPPPNCDPMPGSPNYDPACVVTPSTPLLTIKKAAQGQDGQSLADAAQVTPGSAFSYTYTVANTGSGSATGVTITDTFPRYVSVTAVPTGTDWTCAKGTKVVSGITYHTVICTYNKTLPANTTAPVITVPAYLDPATPEGSALRNIAYVCRTGDTRPECNPNCIDPNTPGCTPPPPPPNCDPMPGSPNYDPACVVTGSGFVLSIKKYVDLHDAQTSASGYIVSFGQLVNYSLVVKNEGPGSTTGTTTVTDTLPVGVALSGSITGTNWICNGTGAIVCNSTQIVASGAAFPTINIPVQVTATSGSVLNLAIVTSASGTTLPGTDRDPAVVNVGKHFLTIKKAAQGQDGQSLADAAQVTPGSAFSYTYTVANTGSGSATGVTITDTFPRYVSVTAVPTGTDWTCAKGTKVVSGITYHTVICTYNKTLPANTTAPVVTVPALLDLATPIGSELRNIAYVCRNGETSTECDPICTDPNDPSCTPPPPPTDCNLMPGSPNYDPACVVPNSAKRCDVLSSSPAAATLAPAANVTYTCTAAGTGFVLSDLEYRIKCGSGDSAATYSSGNVRNCSLPNSYSTSQIITCSVRDKSTGVVFSGSDVGSCSVTKSTTSGGCSGSCGGSSIYYIPKCVNGVPSCTQYVANSLAECNAANGNNCMSHAQCDPAGLATLSCSGGGGGFCGDGVLQPYAGEECDVGFSATIPADKRWCGQPGEVDASGNPVGCKIRITTNPGANPITGLWMTIPRLSNARLGNSQLDVVPGNPSLGRVNFSTYQMVLGINTQAFTLGDTVGFGVKVGEPLALAIPKNKYFCLGTAGTAMNSNNICTTFGALADGTYQTYPNVAEPGNPYILIGDGYYQYPSTQNFDGTWNYVGGYASSPNNIDLFRGPRTYGSNTLANAFRGNTLGTDNITLFHYSAVGGQPIDLVTLPVKVASPMVGTSSTTLTRSSIATFMNSRTILDTFLSHFSNSTTTSTVTTSTTTTTTGPANVLNVGAKSAPVGGLIVSGTSGLENYKLNGNNNVYAVKGNVTLNCTSGITATPLGGVKTLVVENGDLTINCNNTYPSADTSSSWAFIVKGGNIKISNNVSNLVGVYVAIPEGSSGGKYLSLEGTQTNAIITINGSLYGDASDLMSKRNYLRGTNAYDTLTTGVILSYSNRALVSPPPLLSQYLNNYTVTRVVR